MTSTTRARPSRVVVLGLLGALLGLTTGCGSSATSAGTVVRARPGVELHGADRVTAVVPTGTLSLEIGSPVSKVDGSDVLDGQSHDAPGGGSFVPVSMSFDPLAAANLPRIATAAGPRPTTLSLRVDGHTWPIGDAYRVAGKQVVGAGSRTSYVAVPSSHPEVSVVVSYDGLDQTFHAADGSRDPSVADSLYRDPSSDSPACPAGGWHSAPGVRVSVTCQLTAPTVLPYVAGQGWMGRHHRWLYVHVDATPSLSIGHRAVRVGSVTDRTTLRRGRTTTPPLARLALHPTRGVLDDDLVFDTARDRPPATVRVAIVVTLKDGPVHRLRVWREIRLP